MDDAGLVRDFQGLGNLRSNSYGLGYRQARAATGGAVADHLVERAAGHELHDDRLVPRGLDRAVDLRDARVVERGQRPRLALESLSPVHVAGKGVGQDLQRDVAIELRVAGAKHLSHPTLANGSGHFVDAEACAGSE